MSFCLLCYKVKTNIWSIFLSGARLVVRELEEHGYLKLGSEQLFSTLYHTVYINLDPDADSSYLVFFVIQGCLWHWSDFYRTSLLFIIFQPRESIWLLKWFWTVCKFFEDYLAIEWSRIRISYFLLSPLLKHLPS